jgi:UDP-N-acetylglucosamine--N-acetylmuramyl-(pentapeptide) pyrophosphoryl-undecaprenol N-acetylglucosamine transferase
MEKLHRVLIVAGGTGGHVFPALSVAHLLCERGVHVQWIGTRRGIEAKKVVDCGIPIYFIHAMGLRGKTICGTLRALFWAIMGFFQSVFLMWRCHPDVVLAMGGFVTAPVGLAAWLLRKPLVLHEQNSVLGLANRLLSQFAKTVLTGFPKVQYCSRATVYVGNPVRRALSDIPGPQERCCEEAKKQLNCDEIYLEKALIFHERRPLRVLIFGGSQGAGIFNRVLPTCLAKLSKKQQIDVWHQTGVGRSKGVEKTYAELNMPARVNEFIEDMATAYSWADLVIARAGALTIAELNTIGLPAILVPYAHAADDHQRLNAAASVYQGSAIMLLEKQLDVESVGACLASFLKKGSRERLLKMACQARAQRQNRVAERILEELNHVI